MSKKKHISQTGMEAELAAKSAVTASLKRPVSDREQLFEGETEAFHAAVTRIASSDPPGQQIGPYRLTRRLGEGGMGSVWEAEQLQPVRRQVAIKLIRPDFNSTQLLARFELERQTLALMEHPGIAKILDAGTTSAGQPWFAMELVRGATLTRYCDEHRMSIEERLGVLLQVCSAVQHAHQKGVVHRDLKPGNIVVTEVDGSPVPKVIDFGLAKAVEDLGLTQDQSTATGFGQVLGTLKYMSPEQASGNTKDIDTRADIYALGVILCELLTGRTPREDFKAGNQDWLDQLQRIRAEEPIRPSEALRRMDPDSRNGVAAARRVDANRLIGFLTGDLDWIVLRALENDRNLRYQSAGEMQRDIERCLSSEPIEARPPSLRYRIGKFTRKNRVLAISGGLLLTSLLLGFLGTGWGLLAARSAQRAESKRADGERAANLKSQERLKQIQKGNTILANVFRDLDVIQATAGEEPLESLLTKRLIDSGNELDEGAVGDPLSVALLKHQLAESLMSLGAPDSAIELFLDAKAIRDSQLGALHIDSLASSSGVAEAYLELGNADLALPILQFVLENRISQLGPDDPATLQSMNNLAEAHKLSGNLDKAIGQFEETVAANRRVYGDKDYRSIISLNNLGIVEQMQGQIDKAIRILSEAKAAGEIALGLDHPVMLTTMNNLAMALQGAGKTDEAGELFERTFSTLLERRGSFHIDTLRSATNLADFLCQTGAFEKARPLLDKTLADLKSRFGLTNRDTLICMRVYAAASFGHGDFETAIQLYEQMIKAISLGDESLADESFRLESLLGLAASQWATGDLAQAKGTYAQALEAQDQFLGREHPETLVTLSALAVICRDLGDVETAIPMLQEALRLGPALPQLSHVPVELRSAYAMAGKTSQVMKMLESDLATARKSFSDKSLELASALHAMGFDAVRIGEDQFASKLLRECLTIRQELLPNDWRTFNTMSVLGESLVSQLQKQIESGLDSDEVVRESSELLETALAGLNEHANEIPRVSRALRLAQARERIGKLQALIGKLPQQPD